MNQDLQASVDVVLLTLRGTELCVALARRDNPNEPFHGHFALPGGFVHVDADQDTDDTAQRVVLEKVGIQSPYLEQLRTFSGSARDPRRWSISVAYVGLVPAHVLPTVADDRITWRAVDGIKSLPFDHASIVSAAVDRVRSKTAYSSLPLFLLPPTFTLRELQAVYEALMQGPLEKRGFRRRIEELGMLEPVPGQTKIDGSRPAQVYRRRGAASALKVAGALIEVRN